MRPGEHQVVAVGVIVQLIVEVLFILSSLNICASHVVDGIVGEVREYGHLQTGFCFFEGADQFGPGLLVKSLPDLTFMFRRCEG